MTGEPGQPGAAGASAPGEIREAAVLRRTADGWMVGDEQVPDLTCAMVLADLFAAELTESSPGPSGQVPAAGAGADEAVRSPAGPAAVASPARGARGAAAAADAGASHADGGASATDAGASHSDGGASATDSAASSADADAAAAGASAAAAAPAAAAAAAGAAGAGAGAAGRGVAASGPGDNGSSGAGSAADDDGYDEAGRLRMTVNQLERALAVRIRVEQAIGVLAERHRVRPRQAFEQLRSVARARGQRVIDIAGDVIASATNPLLPLPEELSRPNLTQRQRAVNRRRARESQ